jgi:hypothetical protein
MSRMNPIVIFLVITALLAGGYFFYQKTSPATALSAEAGPASSAEQSFVTLVSALSAVNFDTAVLTDARFKSLVDIRTAVVAEPAGRKDPFASFSGATVAPVAPVH